MIEKFLQSIAKKLEVLKQPSQKGADQEVDPRTRLIALGIAVVLVIGGNFLYSQARQHWYKNEDRVIARIFQECQDSVDQRLKNAGPKVTVDQKAEWQNKALQECQKIKESCEKKFQQEMCVLAQRQFQNPQ